MPETEKRVKSIGWFYEGKAMNWTVEPAELLVVEPDGKVLLGGIEIASWSEACRKSKTSRNWIKPS